MSLITSRLLLPAALTATAFALLVACNNASETTAAMQPPPTTMGNQVDDTVITSSVKTALLADPAIKSLDLQVETRKGMVQLSGFVDSQDQIDKALVVVRGVSGVMGVDNSVTLKGSSSTMGSQVDDTTVTGRVKAALLSDPGIKSMDISVVTYKGEVQLTGFVNNQGQIDQAAQIARAAEGATSLKNELKIKQ